MRMVVFLEDIEHYNFKGVGKSSSGWWQDKAGEWGEAKTYRSKTSHYNMKLLE